ncbi:MAG: adenylosuccinate lyase [Bacteroidetes bacterium]|nr:adenylosuccinate lyase [Bacteroidota bacterium]
MEFNQLSAVSPVDGRYRKQCESLANYFSEYALIKYRVYVEVAYFIFLSEKKMFSLKTTSKQLLRNAAKDFSLKDALKIKEIEKTTNHDVKAVEYFLKQLLEKTDDRISKEWIHFGLTSQDINNTAIPLSWKHCMQDLFFPRLSGLISKIHALAVQWKDVPMLARTHGQPASPTKLGKEIFVFVERLQNQITLFSQIPYTAKFGGATGNFNAHYAAFPHKDWIGLANEFVIKKLTLQRLQFTTQIDHYDHLAAHLDCLKRINTILIDFSRDMWSYISLDYFKQMVKKGEVGSSAMPHKVNPIDFENAEGNLGIANALLEHLSGKLPISRLQRDLTDSTVLRNLGVPVAHIFIAFQSLEKGLGKLLLNEEKIKLDLENNWVVLAEAIQTILRRENFPGAYEVLKDLTRGKGKMNKEKLFDFIDTLDLKPAIKKELKKLNPENYTGNNPDF